MSSKVNKHNSMGIKDRKPDCIYYRKCLDEAAINNLHNLPCSVCKDYKQKVCLFTDYTNFGEDCFDEHNVGNL